MSRISSFDGRIMNEVKTVTNGAVNHETIFRFIEKDGLTCAEYVGGKVKFGYLIGKISNGKFELQYTQIHTDIRLDGGYSTCEIELLGDGRIRLVEYFS